MIFLGRMLSHFCRVHLVVVCGRWARVSASAGLQARRSGVEDCPVVRPNLALRRVMGRLLPVEGRQKSEALLSAPRGIRATCPASVRLPNRGVRERLCASQVATRFRERKESICCGYGEERCRKTGKDFIACADSDSARGSRDCVQSRFSQLKLLENRRKQFHR